MSPYFAPRSTGFRYAKSGYDTAGFEGNTPNVLQSTASFEGGGLTAALDLRKPVWCNVALIGGLRGSLIYGETDIANLLIDDNGNVDNAAASREEDDFIYIVELKMGAETVRDTCYGRLSLHAMAEAQLWANGTFVDGYNLGNGGIAGGQGFGVFNHDMDYGFFGANVGVTLER